MCGIGGGYVARHNRIRDWAAATHAACTGLPASTEQRVPEWDRLDPQTGVLEAAVLDVAFSDSRTGRRLLGDVVVKSTFSQNHFSNQDQRNFTLLKSLLKVVN